MSRFALPRLARLPGGQVGALSVLLLGVVAVACSGQPSMEGWICIQPGTCMLDPTYGDPGHYATNGEYDPCHCFDYTPQSELCPLGHGEYDGCPERLDAGEVGAGGRAP